MNPRISKWLLLGCAAMMLAACSADTSLLEPESIAPAAQPGIVPSRSSVETTPPKAPAADPTQPKRGRYAMAAS